MSNDRIAHFDFLKVIGLSCIILAHVEPPRWLMELRNFDVPLMVLLSAVLGQMSFARHAGSGRSVGQYLYRRVQRLVFPTWILLTIFFGLMLCVGTVFPVSYYISSFLLTRYGIGYVWVILIYLYCAVLTPLFYRLERVKNIWLLVVGVYVLYEILYAADIGTSSKVVETTFYYIIPYGLLTFLGYHYNRMSKKQKITVTVASLLIFAGLALFYGLQNGTYLSPGTAKYPPRVYYLAYGAGISMVLLQLCESRRLKLYEAKWVRFLSDHSLWIYLWHILVLIAYPYLKLPKLWYLKLVIVYGVSVWGVFVVNKLLDRIETKKQIKLLRYFRY